MAEPRSRWPWREAGADVVKRAIHAPRPVAPGKSLGRLEAENLLLTAALRACLAAELVREASSFLRETARRIRETPHESAAADTTARRFLQSRGVNAVPPGIQFMHKESPPFEIRQPPPVQYMGASRRQCPKCDGSGRLRHPFDVETVTCDGCDGAGRL